MGKLVLYMPDGSTREFLLAKERVTIGRRADNDIALPFPAVSAEHAAIITVLSDSFLEDLGSTNGTRVNGKTIAKHYLRDGDRIDVGRENLIYYSDDAALAEPLPPELRSDDHRHFTPVIGSSLVAEVDAVMSRPMRKGGAKGESRHIAMEREPLIETLDPSEQTKPFRAVISEPTGEGASAVDPKPVAQAVDTGDEGGSAFAVRVESGASAGREWLLSKPEFTVGRIGVAVALLKRVDDGIWLVPLESVETPLHQGKPIPEQGVPLAPGDRFEIAGTSLILVQRPVIA